MEINREEAKKLLTYIEENYKKINLKELPFNLHALIKNLNNKTYKFNISKKIEEFFINFFIDNEDILNEKIPVFISENNDCIISSIRKNIDSIKYIPDTFNLDEDLNTLLAEEAIKQNYILNDKSLKQLCSNFIVCENSIKLDPFSADYVIWNKIQYHSEENYKTLIKLVASSKYFLTEKSHEYLRKNLIICINSIDNDPNSYQYVPLGYYEYKVYFDKLKEKGIVNYDDIRNKAFPKKMFLLEDDKILDIFLDRFWNLEYSRGEVKKFIKSMLQNSLKIETINKILEVVANDKWEKHKEANPEIFNNVFHKVCSELRNRHSFKKTLSKAKLTMKVCETDENSEFLRTCREYHKIYNSFKTNKRELLIPYQDKISEYCSLYIVKSREKYIDDLIFNINIALRNLYDLNLENEVVQKQVLEKKKIEIFRKSYSNKEQETMNFVSLLKEKYSDFFSELQIENIIESLILEKEYNFDSSNNKRYEEFLIFEKVNKLINRLNRGYISIDGIEVKNYKKYIKYSELETKYLYNGPVFNEAEKQEIYMYKQKLNAFNKLKRDVLLQIKKVEIEKEELQYLLQQSSRSFKFNDDYFIFDKELFLKNFSWAELNDSLLVDIRRCNLDLTNKDLYERFDNIVIKSGLCYLLVIDNVCSLGLLDNENLTKVVYEIVRDYDKLMELSDTYGLKNNNLLHLINLHLFNKYISPKNMAILGENMINKSYIKNSSRDSITAIVNASVDLFSQMSKKTKSTVPYVEGECLNYKYSMYDIMDPSILTCGVDTNSCFRLFGIDDDFLHYCCLDKNGFVIKITDDSNNFVAKASGFRNGNCVYINQLRSIYDYNFRTNIDKQEGKEIIKVFTKACEDIITASENNDLEEEKINFIFITKSYMFHNITSNVKRSIEKTIGEYPMDNKSNDWKEFVSLYPNYMPKSGFNTDYGNYSVICVASNKPLKANNIHSKDVPALYQRKRNEVIVSENINNEIKQKINRIAALNAHLKEEKYNNVNIPDNSKVYVGDDWYIISSNNDILDDCLLTGDERGKKEYLCAMKSILGDVNLSLDNEENIGKKHIKQFN